MKAAPLLVALLAARALGAPAAPDRPLVVGVFEAPPYATKGPDGSWHGLEVDVFAAAAKELGFSYRFREEPLDTLLAGIVDGSVDVVAAPVAVTAERERAVDFSHVVLTSELGFATSADSESGRWRDVARSVLSIGFLEIVGGLAALFLVAGFAVWLFEKRRNPEQFGGRPWAGIGAGFWWSGVTYSGVGYGDKVPVTLGGRLVALVWMLSSVFLVASFTAALSARLAISRFDAVRSVSDLPSHVAGAVGGSPAEDYLRRHRVRTRRFASLQEALAALGKRRVDVVLGPAPELESLAAREGAARVDVTRVDGERQSFAFALRDGSPLREPLDRALLSVQEGPLMREIEFRYLGR